MLNSESTKATKGKRIMGTHIAMFPFSFTCAQKFKFGFAYNRVQQRMYTIDILSKLEIQ